MKPRALWACQPVAFITSAKLAPLVRFIHSRTLSPLPSSRRVPACWARGALCAFLGLGSCGAAALALPWAFFWPLGAPVFLVAAFFEVAFSGATCAPCAATAAACSVVVVSAVDMVILDPFCA